MFKWEYIWINLIIATLAYFIGSINIGIILSKFKGKDIREIGSKNAGATNVLRNYGFKLATLVFLFDFFKSLLTILSIFLVKHFTKNEYILPIIAGLGILLGHIYPIYFKFKGGKGVASFIGMIFAFDFMLFTLFAMLYIAIMLITKYISLASAISCLVIPFLGLIPKIYLESHLAFMQTNTPYPVHAIILIFCAAIIILKHIPNYIRLSSGKENKLNI
ncbi:glycerol-3-phosphate 1-O-acyltransferase PlsY [Metamycoplasma equirhinis]|uniref:glycerol-3-phosphate 1-O-acyltransferase PlsY n=1 Tax=Metamycoplasma equirhinis TaxID=92402 RepID=UPI00359C3B0A